MASMIISPTPVPLPPAGRRWTLFGILALLVATALILGYFIYLKYAPPEYQSALPEPERTFPNYERPEDALIAPPSDAPPAVQESFETFVRQVAEAATEIQLRDCAPTPLIVRIPIDGAVTVHNMDTSTRTIEFEHRAYTIPTGRTVDIAGADFTDGPAIYGYGCDGKAAGIALVEARQ